MELNAKLKKRNSVAISLRLRYFSSYSDQTITNTLTNTCFNFLKDFAWTIPKKYQIADYNP